MPALSYQPWKAAKVESGECRQTIRLVRKRPIEVGQTLYHWQQQRTPQRRKLGESVCTAVMPLLIHYELGIKIADRWLERPELEQMAIADGFSDFAQFFRFFRDGYGLPFDGVVIQWNELIKPLAETVAIGSGRVQLAIAEVV